MSEDAILRVAVEAARAAGEHMRVNVGTVAPTEKSNAQDLVTAVDKECQRLIQSHVSSAFPGASSRLTCVALRPPHPPQPPSATTSPQPTRFWAKRT
jgi:hypothetical protein